MALAILSVLVASRAVCAEAGEAKTQQPLDILEPDQTEKELKAYLSRHVPKFVAPTNADKWNAEAKRLRQQVLDEVVLRGVPKRWLSGPPNVVWGEKTPAPGYTIRKLRYEAVPGLWAGALLYEPQGLTGKVPAVLNTNGHVGEPGMSIDYKQARCINLAKRRILALNLEWIGMGQLRGPGYSHYDLAYLDLCGRSGLSVFYLLLKRGLDVLCSREAADPERIAVTGLSGGGWQTIFISSLDQRVKLAAPNAGYIALPDRIKHRGDIGDLEQNPTDLVSIAVSPRSMSQSRQCISCSAIPSDLRSMSTRTRERTTISRTTARRSIVFSTATFCRKANGLTKICPWKTKSAHRKNCQLHIQPTMPISTLWPPS
ncbi:MAG: hypothetical protein AMJ84_10630 [Acidithiobacillales bacterium SM23_46]|nr:MAG: hypothetical protein AMJ84_10630 [Acidithiobacillales bacterium SM23_46]